MPPRVEERTAVMTPAQAVGPRRRSDGRRPRLLVIGPTPPPHHGISTFMERFLVEPALHEAFDVRHLETADRRGLDNLGQFDAQNVLLAVRHALQLCGALIRHRPHVVYFEISQNTWAYLRDSLWIVLPRLAGSRVAVRLNGSDFRAFYGRSNVLVRWLIRVTSRLLAGVAVLGEGLRPIYEGLVPAARVSVVPNGAADLFSGSGGAPAPAAAAVVSARRPRVTYLGALYRPKGILEYLGAVALLRERGVDAEFVAAGGWFSEDTRVAAMAHMERLGLDGAVEFPGIVAGEAKLALLRDTAVLVFPGVQAEGQPFVILEAMAAGVAVVSTAKGAIEDMVLDGETGFIVPDRSPEAIADAVARLLEDPPLRRRMGEAGRAHFLARFTDARSLDTLLAWLQQVAGNADGNAAGQAGAGEQGTPVRPAGVLP
jgi:glycosyltransferase involved in cell wall biosynthesis